jgi:hypothetical protein
MQAATRRNMVLLAAGVVLVLLLWQVPGRSAPASTMDPGYLTPQPTPTVETHWREVAVVEGEGNRDLHAEGWQVTVPGPWRIRAVPEDEEVLVRVIDVATGSLFARVWAGGSGHGDLATLPEGNGTFSLQVEAGGAYTLYVEAWEAPKR